VTKPDDSSLDPEDLRAVEERHASSSIAPTLGAGFPSRWMTFSQLHRCALRRQACSMLPR
jgi:hypothetical protein